MLEHTAACQIFGSAMPLLKFWVWINHAGTYCSLLLRLVTLGSATTVQLSYLQ